jgi:L-malate glycosyltransferase
LGKDLNDHLHSVNQGVKILKKLLILTSSFPFHKGDYHGNFVYYHALGEVKLGYEVHVLCPHIPGALIEETVDGISVHRFPYFFPQRLQKVSSCTGMYSSVMNSGLASLELPFFFFFELFFALRLINKYHIDIIHSHWIIPQGLVGTICKNVMNKPHIVSSHVLDAQIFEKWTFLKPLLRIILSGVDALTTNSKFTKDVIEDLVTPKTQSLVIPMGVQLVLASNTGRKSDSPTILFVGRLIEWKGVDTLIRAMIHVIRKKPGAVLFVAGEGPLRGDLEQLSRKLAVEESIRLLGRIDDDELAKLYNQASVLVLPSRPFNGIVMEGLGVVLLEAMSHGVPVIGSNTGGIPDIIKDNYNGFLVPFDNDIILAERILQITSDDDLIEKFRQRSYEIVHSKFSWDIIARRFSEVYLQELKRHSNGESQ